MRAKQECPKCGALVTWIVWEGDALVQKCTCGLNKYLYQVTPHGVTIMKRTVRSSDVRLTEPGTKLHTCLLAVALSHPNPINTGSVARHTKLPTKIISARMITLMTRGLVDRVEGRKGKIGGSTWRLSSEATRLLRIEV